MIRLLAIFAVFSATLPVSAFALDWNSNEISYWYGDQFREPGVSKAGHARNIPKNILSLTHADGFSLGQNFINIDILRSSSADPANNSTNGATEVYVVDRQDFSLNKVLDTKAFAFGPVRDVAVDVGVDLNTKNTTFDSEKRMPVAGVAAFFDVPGFWKVAVLWEKEWNHNGITDKNVEFNSIARLETAWETPFKLLGQSFTFEGFGNFNGSKGIDGFGAKTRNEVLLHSQVMWDVGSVFDHPHMIKVGAGYQYWLNKFGNDRTATQGSLEAAPFVRISTEFSF